jgi:hypothetical protein
MTFRRQVRIKRYEKISKEGEKQISKVYTLHETTPIMILKLKVNVLKEGEKPSFLNNNELT